MSDFDNPIYASSRFNPQVKKEPKVDVEVSKIVGKKVFQNDSRVIKMIVKWKGGKPQDSMQPDNFLRDSEKIKELKKAFS